MKKLVLKAVRAPITLTRLALDRMVWPAWVRFLGVRCDSSVLFFGRPNLHIFTPSQITIGHSVKFYSRPNSNVSYLTSPCVLSLLKREARITIGDESAFSGTVICAATLIEIGHRVLVGANAKIVDTHFHPVSPLERRQDQTAGAITGPVSIGDDCWIGMNAIILAGTVLGSGCVVGAGAVVSGSFPSNTVLVGNPARAVRKIVTDGPTILADQAKRARMRPDLVGLL